jgi:hypothetical protein
VLLDKGLNCESSIFVDVPKTLTEDDSVIFDDHNFHNQRSGENSRPPI